MGSLELRGATAAGRCRMSGVSTRFGSAWSSRSTTNPPASAPTPYAGWILSGNLAELAGVEFNEIFAWFLEAEWQADWADARARLGDDATTTDLARPQAQRCADALVAMARAAALARMEGPRHNRAQKRQRTLQGHNHLKERGFDVFRDEFGDWHVIDPEGNEIT